MIGLHRYFLSPSPLSQFEYQSVWVVVVGVCCDANSIHNSQKQKQRKSKNEMKRIVIMWWWWEREREDDDGDDRSGKANNGQIFYFLTGGCGCGQK